MFQLVIPISFHEVLLDSFVLVKLDVDERGGDNCASSRIVALVRSQRTALRVGIFVLYSNAGLYIAVDKLV